MALPLDHPRRAQVREQVLDVAGVTITGATPGTLILVVGSNFGAAGGSIIGHAIHFDSNASGTVKGSVINLN